jgi:hypothetical protein
MSINKSKIFFIISFVVIVIAVLNLAIYLEYQRQVKGGGEPIEPAAAAEMAISTDKTNYQKSEPVEITIINRSSNEIKDNSGSSSVSLNARDYMGANYGVAVIEQFIQGRWVAVEPVWRCAGPCYTACYSDQAIPSGEELRFTWRQDMLLCYYDERNPEPRMAEPGRYRITSAKWINKINDYQLVHSNEFQILDN